MVDFNFLYDDWMNEATLRNIWFQCCRNRLEIMQKLKGYLKFLSSFSTETSRFIRFPQPKPSRNSNGFPNGNLLKLGNFCIVSTSIYNWDTYWLQRAWHLSTFSLCRSGRCTMTDAVCGPTAVTNRPWGTSPSTTRAQSSSAVAMTGTSSSGTLRQVRKFQKYSLSDCLV